MVGRTKKPTKRRFRCGQWDDSLSQYASIADNASLSVGLADRTFTFWLDIAATSNNTMGIMGKWTPANQEYLAYTTLINGYPVVRWIAENITNSASVEVTGTIPLELRRWNFVHLYYDSVGGLMGSSLNRRPAQTASLVGGIRDGTSPFEVGRFNSSNTFRGRIASLASWSRLLTADEISAIYGSGVPDIYEKIKMRLSSIDTNIAHWYNFTVDTNDSSPAGNNLTNNNGITFLSAV